MVLQSLKAWEIPLFDFVFDVPLLIVGPALVILMCSLAVIGLVLVRRHVLSRWRITEKDGHFISTMVHSVMVFYGLTVALIAITVWETYAGAAKVVSREATTLAVLYRNVGNYPEPMQTQLQSALRDYVEHVIDEAWPEQKQGRIPEAGVGRINRFEDLLMSFEPTTDRLKLLHQETLGTYDEMIDARRMRLDAVRTALPGLMWTVIFFGAALGLTGSYFFRVGDPRVHTTLVLLLATFIALVIFVVLAFDRPFRGDMGISAEPYQLIYDQLMRP